MEHKFKFGDQDVTYRSGTVRDRQVRKLILRKLYDACGGLDNISEVDSEIMWDYANYLANTSVFEAEWRRDVGDTPERLYEGYTLFAEAPAQVYDAFRGAQNAAETGEKKEMKSS